MPLDFTPTAAVSVIPYHVFNTMPSTQCYIAKVARSTRSPAQQPLSHHPPSPLISSPFPNPPFTTSRLTKSVTSEKMAPRQPQPPRRRPWGAGMTYPFPNESQLPHCRWEMHRNAWVCRAKDRFQQLILYGESQPSNGTVRGVEYPDGKSVFSLWYGSVPDKDLQSLLVWG